MALLSNYWGLYTDFYELTMAQGYFYSGKKNDTATFNYYFRTNPYKGGFTVFAGLQNFLKMLTNFRFSDDDTAYLSKQGFKQEFLKYLSEFRFSGDILSVCEGEIMFPNEPLLQVEGNIIEGQLIESLLLNILNFESLVATKAFRIKLVTNGKVFSDFGLRRAQGLGAIHASHVAVGGQNSSRKPARNCLCIHVYRSELGIGGFFLGNWRTSLQSESNGCKSYFRYEGITACPGLFGRRGFRQN